MAKKKPFICLAFAPSAASSACPTSRKAHLKIKLKRRAFESPAPTRKEILKLFARSLLLHQILEAMEVLTIDQIKARYPDEWVLLSIESEKNPQKGKVLLHGKDYLEVCYKGSEIAKNKLTTLIYTGTITKNRKWLKFSRLQEKPATT